MPDSCIYHGSVKDIFLSGEQYLFRFSDRYSIFDWGEMPDLILGKGSSLVQMTRSLYQIAAEQGFKHHLITEKKGFANELWVKPCDLSLCQFDETLKKFSYHLSDKKHKARALPLEVVFRFAIEASSSFVKRAQDKQYLLSLGLTDQQAQQVIDQLLQARPKFPIQLPRPVVECFTKLEPIDRLLSYAEAAAISHLKSTQLQDLLAHHLQLAQIWQSWFLTQGLDLIDGKMEWAISYNSLTEWILIDSMGPDEMRLMYKGFHLSKELLRRFYRKTDWYQSLEMAKHKAQINQDPNWKFYLDSEAYKVPSLNQEWLNFITYMYQQFSTLGIQPFSLDITFLKEQLE